MTNPDRRIAALTLALGALCALVFAGLVVFYGRELRADIRRKMIERDAAVLYPVAQQQVEPTASLAALLPDARRQGTLALAIFDAAGVTLEKVPGTQPLVELPLDDLVQLQDGRPITRFHSAFPLSSLRTDAAPGRTSPVLEVILPLYRHGARERNLLGFVRYHLDARLLAAELAALDDNVARKTRFTLFLGVFLLGLIVLAAHFILRRAQRTIAERTARLQRANFELTLSAKASALGQIASHLIHGLQGPVAGLRAMAAGRDPGEAGSDWRTAAGYAERMQAMIHETVALLGDSTAHAAYDLTGHELATTVRQRNLAPAGQKGVELLVRGGFDRGIDSHRGGLLCLITSNLVQNAIEATAAGRPVTVTFSLGGRTATVTVADEGTGIPEEVRAHLFEPGRSGRPGGSGLGLAISQLLARQIGATLALESTGPGGTTFRLTLPLATG